MRARRPLAALVSSSPCTLFRARMQVSKTCCRSARATRSEAREHRASHVAGAVMILARVVGTVVATRKDPRLEGKKLLVVKPVTPEGKDEAGYVIAVDTVSAGFRERVIAVSGSSARMAEGCKDTPVDTAIVGIVDDVHLD